MSKNLAKLICESLSLMMALIHHSLRLTFLISMAMILIPVHIRIRIRIRIRIQICDSVRLDSRDCWTRSKPWKLDSHGSQAWDISTTLTAQTINLRLVDYDGCWMLMLMLMLLFPFTCISASSIERRTLGKIQSLLYLSASSSDVSLSRTFRWIHRRPHGAAAA